MILLHNCFIYAWNIVAADQLVADNFERVLQEAAEIEMLLVGMGNDLLPLPQSLRSVFREHGIGCDPMSTGAAVRTLNVLLAEERAVAAALIAV